MATETKKKLNVPITKPALGEEEARAPFDSIKSGWVTQGPKVAEFEKADGLETAYFKAERIPVAYDWHYQHNVDLLATSYQYVGRMAKAEALLGFRSPIRAPNRQICRPSRRAVDCTSHGWRRCRIPLLV